MTVSNRLDWCELERIAAHKASGEPRYSVHLALVGGGFIRRWTDDRQEALAMHAAAVEDPQMNLVVTFDHWRDHDELVAARPTKKTAEELSRDLDEAIDRMIDRWALETKH